ncbi:MAG: type II toxin-antitoxin system RelE/ParE family toxin [Variovorax sp.]|nr:MAG: type II toxin-antitoxin system RelE/ParE family toxin [Variovorax sp.]
MLELEWREAARADLLSIVEYIAQDNPGAALELVTEIEDKAERLRDHPKLYRPGRVSGTREMVVRPKYVVVYSESTTAVTMLRVLHAAQMWPPARP